MAPADHLTDALTAYADQDWSRARSSFEAADEQGQLSGHDLQTFATTMYMLGEVDSMLGLVERSHRTHLDAGAAEAAARSAVWLAANYAAYGKTGPAMGWLKRGEELLGDGESVVTGWMAIAGAARHERAGNFERVIAAAERAAAMGRRFGDADLVAMARQLHGRALLKLDRVFEGLEILDAVMVAVVGGELSPQITGIVYCSVIDGCFEVQEIRRGRDWTAALSAWCDSQDDLVAFTDQCFAHRAEIRRYEGLWDQALAEAAQSHRRHARGLIAAQAFYQQGEVHRLRGEYDLAEASYRSVSDKGSDPQPGLALLRLATGDTVAAVAGIKRAVAEAKGRFEQGRLLPALIEIMLVAGDRSEAEAAVADLAAIAEITGIDVHRAGSSTAQGRWLLASEDPTGAATALRTAQELWIDLGMPYETARTKALLSVALEGMGDADTAQMEREAAIAMLSELGAAEVGELRSVASPPSDGNSHGLTGREMEVLRLMATGLTNKLIADELFISERTIDRHLSNIFTKLGVSSRTAAAAFAFQHDLL